MRGLFGVTGSYFVTSLISLHNILRLCLLARAILGIHLNNEKKKK